MAMQCTYATRGQSTCSKPATHRVVKGWLRDWNTWRMEEVEKADIREGAQSPEFCMRHAGDVMDERNHTMQRKATRDGEPGGEGGVERLSAKDLALQAVLLFHDAGPWDVVKRARWYDCTGTHEATTKVLCDTVRAALRGDAQ